MKIVITQEDVKNSPNYSDPVRCPMAVKMTQLLGFSVTTSGNGLKDLQTMESIGYFKEPFRARHFNALKNGEITEFVTEYTPNT